MQNTITIIGWLALLLLVSCGRSDTDVVDRLNDRSYDQHYRNLDSTRIYADSALNLSENYSAGRAEALNNLAFVASASMDYSKAKGYLDEVTGTTDNQIELLVADVQQMKLCQKQSRNKDFYVFSEQARKRLNRIKDEESSLNDHEKRRLTYASAEYHIVSSAYYYYLGLDRQSIEQIDRIDPYGSIERDTAQLLNYWYNIGSGGIIVGKNQRQVAREEFGYLANCYIIALHHNYPYWVAQALQAMSEHLQDVSQRQEIINDNFPTIVAVNSDMMPDSLIAGNLAQRALDIFKTYGDVYQIAGAWRTLGECYWHIGDNKSALICLEHALKDNKKVEQAPDLVSTIREDLCLVYSAANDKRNSDINRNIYLDLQEQTRQDRQLEARAAQLDESIRELNILIGIVMLMIVAVTVLLIVLARMRRQSDDAFSISELLKPLSEWQKHNEEAFDRQREHFSEISEATDAARFHLQQNRQRNLEQRAKVQLVFSVLPLIDRMVNEIRRIQREREKDTGASTSNFRSIEKGRLQYIEEITDTINQYNNILTRWIQMRQGELSLRIENFPLQRVFDMVGHSAMSFSLSGIKLVVKPTDAVVKADCTLTLFMVNTIADNARKFTPRGGTVTIEAQPVPHEDGQPSYVEISVTDTGTGMPSEVLTHVFDRTYTGGHGFGLRNCKGIIEKYRKISTLFSDCLIGAKSTVGKGSRIYFHLPIGRLRTIGIIVLLSLSSLVFGSRIQAKDPTAIFLHHESQSAKFADSAYLSNIMSNYANTLRYADSCRKYILPTDTAVLLDVSNEAAVAALALHRWKVYRENNRIYTRLFRMASADSSLPSYIQYMQRSQTNKAVSMVLLIILLLVIVPAWYVLYYRHKLNYKFCVYRINQINAILLSDVSDREKLSRVRKLGDFGRFNLTTEQKTKLQKVVGHIEAALSHNIAHKEEVDTETELASDECHRIEIEAARLHVSNSVLDNCLSTLKHETMYYPSRIKQMIVDGNIQMEELSEVVDYYHDLYALLAEQALRQVIPPRMDRQALSYLLELLRKCNDGKNVSIQEDTAKTQGSIIPDNYIRMIVRMPSLDRLSDKQVSELFTPYTIDMNLLLCRQIVREMGEITNLRASGIEASRDPEGHVTVKILIPKIYYK